MIRIRPVAVLLAFLLTGCSANQAPTPADADAPFVNAGDPVKVVVAPFLGHAPLVLAAESGLLEEHGVEVEVTEVRSPRDALAVFSQGEIDVWAGTTGPAMFTALGSEEGLSLVAARGHIDPEGCDYKAIVVRDSVADQPGWGSAESARGLRVGGTTRNLVDRYYIDAVLERLGLDPGEIEMVEIDRNALVGALESGQIDAAAVAEPRVTQLLDAVPSQVWMPGAEVIPGFELGHLAFGERLRKEDPELGVRFMAGYLEALEQYAEGATEENLDLLEGKLGLERDVLEAACWPTVHQDALVNTDDLMRQQEYAVEEGLLDEPYPIEELWDPTIVEQARTRIEDGA